MRSLATVLAILLQLAVTSPAASSPRPQAKDQDFFSKLERSVTGE